MNQKQRLNSASPNFEHQKKPTETHGQNPHVESLIVKIKKLKMKSIVFS